MRLAVLVLTLLASLHGGISDERLVGIFSPLKTERAALSPDGKRVGYTLREGNEISVLIADVDHPEHATTKALAALDTLATGYKHPAFVPARAEVRWLAWIDNHRIALSTNLVYFAVRNSSRGAIYAFDADGKNARELASGRHDRGNTEVIGLNPAVPSEILFAFDDASYAVDAFTGKRRSVARADVEKFREQTKTARAATSEQRKSIQTQLRQLLPTHEIDLLVDHHMERRVLALAQSPADPGGFLVYEPATKRLWDFLRRSNTTGAQRALRTERFSIPAAESSTVSGLLVYPVDPRLQRAPLLVWMSDQPGRVADRRYRPEIQALAEFGFAVVLFDEPSSVKAQAPQPDRTSFFSHAIDQLAAHFPVSRRSVAVIGKAAGARRAFEIAVQAPQLFRCIVAVAPTPDRLDPVVGLKFRFVEQLRKVDPPVVVAAFVCSWPGPPRSVAGWFLSGPPVQPSAFGPHAAARSAIAALERSGVDARLRVETDDFRAERPEAIAATFRAIESFLNEQLYRYSATLGEIEVLGSDVPLPQR